jgi:alcohol dehydrogenase
MKAAQISEYGDASVVNVNEVEKPPLSEGQVLVEVYASSLNPFDSMVRDGYVKEAMPLQLPATLGGDIAGKVVELGAGVKGFEVGDIVYGQASVVAGNSGAFAEFAATKAGQVAKAPDNLDFNELASLPLVGVSALQALTEHLKLQAGQKIFITGGAGGIGRVAIMLAKYLGAHVATTVALADIELAKELGADEVIDYTSQNFLDLLSDYDAVFDTVGGGDFNKTLDILKPGGIAVTMSGQPDQDKAKDLGVTAIAQSTHVTTVALDKLRDLIEQGVIKPQVGRVFKLEEIRQAFVAREHGKVSGKVVLQIKD